MARSEGGQVRGLCLWPGHWSGWRHGESNPGPPACKLAAGPAFAVAEHVRGAPGGYGARL